MPVSFAVGGREAPSSTTTGLLSGVHFACNQVPLESLFLPPSRIVLLSLAGLDHLQSLEVGTPRVLQSPRRVHLYLS